MVSMRHEAIVELIRLCPAFAAEMLTGVADLVVPEYESAELGSPDLSEVVPTERRADAVVTLNQDGRAVLGIVVEVQLGHDSDKTYSWPSYVISLRQRLRCPVEVLVVCVDDSVARWAAQPIQIGRGSMITPIVVGPNLVPVIDDADVAASSRELAMLSAMAHYAVPEVLEALAAAIATDFEHGHVYSELIWAVLSGAARAKWERLVTATTWEYQSPFARKYYGEGKAEGEAAGILTVLHARGIDVPDAVRERVQSCDDIEQLETWLRRAATAQTIGDVFD
jgi:hypothetical protein